MCRSILQTSAVVLLLLSASAAAAEALAPSGALYWGATWPAGQLSYKPVPLPGDLPLLADTVSVGYDFACGLYTNASIWCVGNNMQGQLGTGDGTPATGVPTPVAGGRAYSQVAASQWSTWACGLLKVEQTVECWGSAIIPTSSGELVVLANSSAPAVVVPAAGIKFSTISVGILHVCGVEDGTARVICWGDNLKGELGRGVPGDAVISPAAISVPAGLQFDQVLASNHFSYARALDGQWWCCGSNEYGQCAQNSTSAELPTPVPVPESAGYQELQLGGTHVCAIREKRLLCWGMNSSGQLGCGDTCADLPESTGLGAGVDGPYSAVPLEVAGGLRWSQVAPAVYFTCGVTTDRTAMCWGFSYVGAAPLGRGQLSNTSSPAEKDLASPYPVTGGHAFRRLAAGYGTTIGFLAGQPISSPAAAPGAAPAVASAGAAAPAVATASAGADTSSTPTGAIVGGVVGGVAALAVCAALVVGWRRGWCAGKTVVTAAGRMNGDGIQPAAPGAAHLVGELSQLGPATNGAEATALPFSYVSTTTEGTFATGSSMLGEPAAARSLEASLEDDQLLPYINSSLASAPRSQRRHPASLAGPPPASPLARAGSSALPAEVQQWEVQWEDLQVLRAVGRGSYGRVYLGRWQSVPVAIKVLLGAEDLAAGTLELPEPVMRSLLDEARVLTRIRHPNVLSFLGLCSLPPCLLTEYCAHGSLYDVLSAASRDASLAATLTWRRRLGMLMDAAAGLAYLHTRSPPIIHRDVKSPNLLVDEFWRVKVADFNLSLHWHPAQQPSGAGASEEGVTNPTWMAPELLEGGRATQQSDIYALGLVMYEAACWRLPWSHGAGAADEPHTVFGIAAMVRRGERPPMPHLSALPGPRDIDQAGLQAYCELMSECWAVRPQDRPALGDVMERLRALLASLP